MTNRERGRGTGEDGELGRRLEALREAIGEMGGGRENRRDELVERAEARGLSRPAAEQAYDIAREVELDPAHGMALVLEGISVQPFEGPRPDVDSSEPNEPEWVDRPPDPELAERERRLRQTFRRLRSKLEEHDSENAALDAFAAEPDLEPYDY